MAKKIKLRSKTEVDQAILDAKNLAQDLANLINEYNLSVHEIQPILLVGRCPECWEKMSKDQFTCWYCFESTSDDGLEV